MNLTPKTVRCRIFNPSFFNTFGGTFLYFSFQKVRLWKEKKQDNSLFIYAYINHVFRDMCDHFILFDLIYL